MQTVCILPYIWKMTKPLTSGTKKSESLLTEFSVLVKKITSGSMVQAPVVHVQKSTMTVERNMAVGNLAVQ